MFLSRWVWTLAIIICLQACGSRGCWPYIDSPGDTCHRRQCATRSNAWLSQLKSRCCINDDNILICRFRLYCASWRPIWMHHSHPCCFKLYCANLSSVRLSSQTCCSHPIMQSCGRSVSRDCVSSTRWESVESMPDTEVGDTRNLLVSSTSCCIVRQAFNALPCPPRCTDTMCIWVSGVGISRAGRLWAHVVEYVLQLSVTHLKVRGFGFITQSAGLLRQVV